MSHRKRKKKKQTLSPQSSQDAPKRTINNGYHISILQTLRLLQGLSVDTGWIHRAQICQNNLGDTKQRSSQSQIALKQNTSVSSANAPIKVM